MAYKKSDAMNDPTGRWLAGRIDGTEGRLDRHEAEHEKLWTKINRVENRLPIWATLLIAIMGAAIGKLV